jgi:hypothetical protein
MKIRQGLLDRGFRVALRNADQVDELSKELHRIGYTWYSGATLIDLKYLNNRGESIIYIIPEKPSKLISKTSEELRSYIAPQEYVRKYEEIKEDCSLYKKI